mmetsp:Transcript_13525/g.54242  ORF Transcript_13525/g.54242 Transcript_13525/m.54242 type:complete len:214 (-) Transcript_13525:451-1092(-)
MSTESGYTPARHMSRTEFPKLNLKRLPSLTVRPRPSACGSSSRSTSTLAAGVLFDHTKSATFATRSTGIATRITRGRRGDATSATCLSRWSSPGLGGFPPAPFIVTGASSSATSRSPRPPTGPSSTTSAYAPRSSRALAESSVPRAAQHAAVSRRARIARARTYDSKTPTPAMTRIAMPRKSCWSVTCSLVLDACFFLAPPSPDASHAARAAP